MKKQKKEEKTKEELKKDLEECQKERDEYLAGWQRQKADIVNHQKEVEARMKELGKMANEELINDFLPVLDSFDLSIKFLQNKELSEEEGGMLKGVEMIRNQLNVVLKKWGLESVESIGQEFNPEFHEAIESGEGDNLIVVEEVLKGYTLNGKLIRPSSVRVEDKNNN